MRSALTSLTVAIILLLLSPAQAQPLSRQAAYARAQDLSALGQAIFFDPAMSASGQQSCASCHDPDHAFGPANALAVQPGGPAMGDSGGRAAPTLTYLQAVPHFSEHFFESPEEGDESVDAGPTGGLTWDGRVDRKRDQARIPLLSPVEMANPTPDSVVNNARHAAYADRIRALGGDDIFSRPSDAFALMLEALEVFQQTPSLFYRYDSKYDAFLAGKTALSASEARGLEVFLDPDRGNCDSCHPAQPGSDGSSPQFSDWGFIALGLPRNQDIPANGNPAHVDLGLCGPDRVDFLGRAEYCGLFRTPSLRNVALKRSFFHNGVYHDLHAAVAFYADRDTRPERIYPRSPQGQVMKFNDLPARYHPNVEAGLPFGQQAGDKPALSDTDVEDLTAFLGTLTDGWRP